MPLILSKGHTQDAYVLYYELVEKLCGVEGVNDPMVLNLLTWFQKFWLTKDGSYLDAYTNLSPSALYWAIYGQGVILLAYNFTKLLEDEDNISIHESTTTSIYGIGEPLAFLTITSTSL
ncbi:hypothetical protein L0F63_006018 [Massospora cicadina]|nr:hypothetical protein L0F63_006018 [Massospora cicadina]